MCEGSIRAVMDAGHAAQRGGGGEIAAGSIIAADFGRQQFKVVAAGACRNRLADIGNVEHGGVDVRIGHESPGLAPPLDQAGADQPGQRLADRRPGAAIFTDQLMLERDAKAWLPFARADPRLDVGPDPLRYAHAAMIRAMTSR